MLQGDSCPSTAMLTYSFLDWICPSHPDIFHSKITCRLLRLHVIIKPGYFLFSFSLCLGLAHAASARSPAPTFYVLSCAASSRSLHFACYAPIQIWAEPENVAQLSTLIQAQLSKPANCFCITYEESLHTCFSDRVHKAGKFPGWGGGCPIFVPPGARAHTRAHLPREHALRERERACAHGCAWLCMVVADSIRLSYCISIQNSLIGKKGENYEIFIPCLYLLLTNISFSLLAQREEKYSAHVSGSPSHLYS